jgi:hypothetical protein
MVVVVPIEGWLLSIILIVGVAVAIGAGLTYRLAGRKRAKTVMWVGVFIAGWCGTGFLLGVITGG